MSAPISCSLDIKVKRSLKDMEIERKIEDLLGDYEKDEDDTGVFLLEENFNRVRLYLRAYLQLQSGPVVCQDGCTQYNPKKKRLKMCNISTQCYSSELLVDASSQVEPLKNSGSQTSRPVSADAASEAVIPVCSAGTSPILFENGVGPEKGRFFPDPSKESSVVSCGEHAPSVVASRMKTKIVIKGLPKSLGLPLVKSELTALGICCQSASRKKSRRNGKLLKPVFCSVFEDADLSCNFLCGFPVKLETFRVSSPPKVKLDNLDAKSAHPPVSRPPPARCFKTRRGDYFCHPLDSPPAFLSRTSRLDILQEAIQFFQVGFPYADPVQLATAARILVDPPQASSLLTNN